MDSLIEKLGTSLQDPTVQIVAVLCVLIYALTWCRIYAKTGQHAALGLLMLIPGVNLVMQLTLAFGRWPLERAAKELGQVRKAVRHADDKALRHAA